jgi:prepilin peptidase CpaA
VKLLAALGAWLGPVLMLVAFAVSVVLGAVLAACTLLNSLATRGVSKTSRKYLSSRRPRSKRSTRRPARVMPFAVPVALGTWMILAWMLTSGRL